MDNAVRVTTKKASKFEIKIIQRYAYVNFPLKVAKSKHDRRDFTHS